MMVLDIKDKNGENYDLANFKDDEQYLKVSKIKLGWKYVLLSYRVCGMAAWLIGIHYLLKSQMKYLLR